MKELERQAKVREEEQQQQQLAAEAEARREEQRQQQLHAQAELKRKQQQHQQQLLQEEADAAVLLEHRSGKLLSRKKQTSRQLWKQKQKGVHGQLKQYIESSRSD